jgi:hypothetical protein
MTTKGAECGIYCLWWLLWRLRLAPSLAMLPRHRQLRRQPIKPRARPFVRQMQSQHNLPRTWSGLSVQAAFADVGMTPL